MKTSHSGIPLSLRPFFQEYDLENLDLQRSSGTIIERTLRFGNRQELRWLFSCYPRARIAEWVAQWGDYGLPEPHLTFWRLLLSDGQAFKNVPNGVYENREKYHTRGSSRRTEMHMETISDPMRQVLDAFGRSRIGNRFYLAGGTALALQLGHRRSVDLDFFSASEDIPSVREPLLASLSEFDPLVVDTSWGNLVFVANSVQVGFYGYGYPLVVPLILADPIRLAGVADIGLMKLDALLARASRKDFHDLYAICQGISLRELLDLAPRKYSHARDFEAQVIRRLTYFERAEAQEPVPLIQEVDWEIVKAFFRQQAIVLGSSWLDG